MDGSSCERKFHVPASFSWFHLYEEMPHITQSQILACLQAFVGDVYKSLINLFHGNVSVYQSTKELLFFLPASCNLHVCSCVIFQSKL